jgi:uroporphyrinogen decarboxylase
MNSRDRVRLALGCQQPDSIPMAFAFFSQSLGEIDDLDEHFGSDVRYAKFNPPADQDDFLAYLEGLPGDVHVGSDSQLKTYHEWNYHPESAAVPLFEARSSITDLTQRIFPDLMSPDRYAGLSEQVDRIQSRGLAVAGAPPHLGGNIFEAAWRMRGFREFMMDLADRQPVVTYLLDQLTQVTLHNAVILAQAGVDVLLLDDDIAMPTDMMIGPGLWREFFKPRLAQVIDLAREVAPELIVFYHSDGNFTRIVPDLVDIGVNVINPVQPDCMDGLTIKRELGDRMAMWGTVGSAYLWDEGTPDQIRMEVRLRANSLGPGGLLLAPAYDLDYAPLQNVMAFVESVRLFSA